MAKDAIKYRMIVIGGSAGSLEVILKIISALPHKIGIPLLIVIHRTKNYDSALADVIAARTKITVKDIEDKEPILADTIYIAPADYHLLVEDETTFSLDNSEKVNHSRPSIDVTFESVAGVFGDASIGILLSGANADGARGLEKIKQAGGLAIAQDPSSAEVGFMPQQAINQNAQNEILHIDEIAGVVRRLLG